MSGDAMSGLACGLRPRTARCALEVEETVCEAIVLLAKSVQAIHARRVGLAANCECTLSITAGEVATRPVPLHVDTVAHGTFASRRAHLGRI